MRVYFICLVALQANILSGSHLSDTMKSPLMRFAARIRAGNIPNRDLWVCKPEDRCDIDVDAFLFVDIKIAYQAIFYIQDKFHQVLDYQRDNWRSSIPPDVPMVETILRTYRRRVERYLTKLAVPEYDMKNGSKLTFPMFFEFSKCAQDYLYNSTFTYIKYYTFNMANMTETAQNLTNEAMRIVIREETKRVAKFEKEMLCEVLFVCEGQSNTNMTYGKAYDIQSPEVVLNNEIIVRRLYVRGFVREVLDIALKLDDNKVRIFVRLVSIRLMKSKFFTNYTTENNVTRTNNTLTRTRDAEVSRSYLRPIQIAIRNGYPTSDTQRYSIQSNFNTSINILDMIFDESNLILEHIVDKFDENVNGVRTSESDRLLGDIINAAFSYYEDYFYSYPDKFEEIKDTKKEMNEAVVKTLPLL